MISILDEIVLVLKERNLKLSEKNRLLRRTSSPEFQNNEIQVPRLFLKLDSTCFISLLCLPVAVLLVAILGLHAVDLNMNFNNFIMCNESCNEVT